MNYERMEELAHLLETVEDLDGVAFDMTVELFHNIDCGTGGRIASWAYMNWRKGPWAEFSTAEVQDVLGLTSEEADALFYAYSSEGVPNPHNTEDLERIDKLEAAQAIRRMVEWHKAKK